MRADKAEHRAIENGQSQRESARRQSRVCVLMRDQFVCDSRGIMVIVPATRGTLRGEFAMSDDASSPSRNSRRSSELIEADYARMHDALMETARGRWFLDEYARRNRNADTSMVLDAVARIESVVASQLMPPTVSPQSNFHDDVRRLIQRARDEIESSPASVPRDTLTPARRAARIIREIAWQMRSCGNDPRICNILDEQLDAIDAGINAPDANSDANLRAVLDTLMANLELAIDGMATGSTPQGDVAEDDAVLARIAAEMATPDDDPDADAFGEPVRSSAPVEPERRKDSLGAMLIARGIIPAPADRDAPNLQIN